MESSRGCRTNIHERSGEVIYLVESICERFKEPTLGEQESNRAQTPGDGGK